MDQSMDRWMDGGMDRGNVFEGDTDQSMGSVIRGRGGGGGGGGEERQAGGCQRQYRVCLGA